MIATVAFIVVALTAAYFLCLGLLALVRPATAKAFLGGLAGSAVAHVSELAVRIVVGASFVVCSSRLMFPAFFAAFGWVLIVTSIGLMMIPWRLHRRFAEWSVPQATRNMKLFAVGSLVSGCLLVWSLRI
ncbi:MAG: hypothetical protein M3P06_01570 [Acidobacteriota bacterium]|nr:hypothetical protein [Acidobacteriota bacterium]